MGWFEGCDHGCIPGYRFRRLIGRSERLDAREPAQRGADGILGQRLVRLMCGLIHRLVYAIL